MEYNLYDFCKIVLAHLTQSDYKIEKIKLNENNFAACFDDQELEDIVGIYLQKEKKCIFYPSSCKQATKSYEYILRDPSNKIVYAQVKHNAKIDVSHYETDDYNNSIVYLYSNKGYINSHNKDNILIINRSDLFDFTIKNLNMFQKRICYTKMLFDI